MLLAGQQISGLPIQTVVRYALLETKRTDLGDLVGEEKVAQQTFFKSWPLDGGAIGCRSWLEVEVAFVGILEDRKEVEVLKWAEKRCKVI
jgi:hypothetical protein